MTYQRCLNKTIICVTVIILLFTAVVLLCILPFWKSDNQPVVKAGVLDLSNYNFSTANVLNLGGKWEFYDNSLLETSSQNPDYIEVPGSWNKIKGSAWGYATYHLNVKGVQANTQFALRIPAQSSAYILYIDGKPLIENGRVATNRALSIPNMNSQIAVFVPTTSSFDLTMQVSNYENADGGMWDDIVIGLPNAVRNVDSIVDNQDFIYFGIILLILFYCICQMIFHNERKSSFYLTIICFIILVRLLGTNDYLILKYIPDLNFKVLLLMDYLTTIWGVAVFAISLKSLYPSETKKHIEYIIIILATIFSLFCMIMPTYIFTKYTAVYQLYAVTVLLYIMIVVFSVVKARRKYSKIVFAACSFLALTVIYDILTASFTIPDILNGEKSIFGFIVFLFFQVYLLSREHVKVMEGQKAALEYTHTTEMKFWQSQIKPHFLYNALSAIACVCSKDAKKAEQLIMDLAFFMQSSFDFSSFDKLSTLEQELAFIKNYVNIEKARFEERVIYVEKIEASPLLELPRLIIEPLIENAITHGIARKKSGGVVELWVHEVADGIEIEVWDNGVGIDAKKIPELLSERNTQKGIGLKNINARLLSLYGKGLTIESEENIFTSVSFIIPADGKKA